MAANVQDLEMSVYFDYCPPDGDCLVILRTLIGQYVCDIGYLRICAPSEDCTGGYHIDKVCGKRREYPQHYSSKEEAAKRLFELWRG